MTGVSAIYGLVIVSHTPYACPMTHADNTPTDKTYLVTWQTLAVVHDTGNAELDQAWAVLTARNTMRDLLADPTEGDNYLTVEAVGNTKPEKAHWQLDQAMDAYDAVGAAVPKHKLHISRW